MVGLTGTRVIVVDDAEEDALPILQALAKKGIPAAFFNASAEALPAEGERLSGVRFAILDIDLIGGGADNKSKIAALVNVLGRLLHPDNGPYAVLAWTNHSDLIGEFDARLFATEGLPKPILVVSLAKSACKTDKEFDLAIVAERLETAIAEFSPLLFLNVWEGQCFEAATDVTNTLSALAAPDTNEPERWRLEWRGQLLQLMHAMAESEAGKHLDDGISALTALYSSLSPLHADRMESDTADLPEPAKRNSPELISADAARDCGTERKAKINSMLHLACNNLCPFHAGNAYLATGQQLLLGLIPSADALFDDLMQKSRNTPENKSELAKVSAVVFVEANATCDHVQKNVRFARLVAGVLVPLNKIADIKRDAEFIWQLGPLFVRPPVAAEGVYYLYLSSRHLVSLKPDEMAQLRPMMRLRSQAFASLQAWFASRMARPGVRLL